LNLLSLKAWLRTALPHLPVAREFLFQHSVEFERPENRIPEEVFEVVALNIFHQCRRMAVGFLRTDASGTNVEDALTEHAGDVDGHDDIVVYPKSPSQRQVFSYLFRRTANILT